MDSISYTLSTAKKTINERITENVQEKLKQKKLQIGFEKRKRVAEIGKFQNLLIVFLTKKQETSYKNKNKL